MSTTPSAPTQDTEPIVIHVPPYSEAEHARVRVVHTPPATPVVRETAPDKRALNLDAVRGVFLVLMIFSFTIMSEQLPPWMYHRQSPPPGDRIVDIAGITWPDLVYGAYLFTMAAALPFSLARRVERGDTELAILGTTIGRYLSLLVFALLIAHSNTYVLGYTQPARVISVLGFLVLAAMYTHADGRNERLASMRRIGWVAAAAFLALTPLTYGKQFSFTRIDDIIVDLAFGSLAGSALWYVTRRRLGLRLAVLGGVMLVYWAARSPGAIQDWWYASPIAWAMSPSRLTLLSVVVPGMIAGDVVLAWMRAPEKEGGWSRTRLTSLIGLSTIISPIVLVGLYTRQVVATSVVVAVSLSIGIALTMRPTTPADRMVRALFVWGAAWLAIGLMLEPIEGGIRKAPQTLTYFFTVSGLTCLLLAAMAALIDGLKREKWARPLIDVGRNPLLGYAAFTAFLNPLLELIAPLRGVLESSPGASLVRSVITTVLVVLGVRYATHKRVFWRT